MKNLTLIEYVVLLLIFALAGAAIGTAFEMSACVKRDRLVSSAWETTAINRGFAQHDMKTGEWRWRTPDEVAADLTLIEPTPIPENTK